MNERRYPVPDCPGISVYKNLCPCGPEGGIVVAWDIERNEQYLEANKELKELIDATVVHAAESYGPWDRKKDAIAEVQSSWGIHADLQKRGWPEDYWEGLDG